MRLSKNTGKIFWGLLFILGAIYMIVSRVWTLPRISLFSIIFTIFFAWMLICGIRQINFWEILFSIAFLCIIYDDLLGIKEFTPWPVLGAALFGSIGLSMIFKKRHTFRIEGNVENATFGSKGTEQCNGSNLRFENNFGETIKYVNTDDLCNVDIENNFGSMQVYFDNAIIQNECAYVNVDNNFGEVRLYVPRAWIVEKDIEKGFGGVNERGHMEGSSTHRLIIHGDTNFGAVTIVYM